MLIKHRSGFETMRWPNGQGVAHEVFHVQDNGQTLWRMSLAEVVGDCVFSAFEGQMRSTTVVSGAGMTLSFATGAISLEPLQPVTWDGALPLTGVLAGGAVENLNLVWDKQKIHADVRGLTAPFDVPNNPDGTCLIFVYSGAVTANGCRLLKGSAGWGVSGPVTGAGSCLLMALRPTPNAGVSLGPKG